MSTKFSLVEQEAIQRRIDKFKNNHFQSELNLVINNTYGYHTHHHNYCLHPVFYVPETNRFYGFDNIPYEFEDFIMNGGMDSLNIDHIQEMNDLKKNYYFWERLLFDKNDMEEFKKNNPWSGVEDFSFSDRLCRYDNKNTQLRYAICYTENPQIEKMMKAGLKLLVEKWVVEPSVLYKRNFKNGKNINEITKLPKYAWQMMAEENFLSKDINAWNEMRVWIQKDNLTKEQMRTILNFNLYDTKTIKDLRAILTTEYEGERVFTLETLLNYLARVDMHQAIEPRESIPILSDYLRMCRALNIEPLTDSNSLKREHDVTVRQFNEQKTFINDQKYAEKFTKRHEELSKYEFTDGRLMVITPKTPEDMRNEGRQNRNCVGSYTSMYATGKSNVMFIRKCDAPERSYITVELSEDFSSTRQAFYASNRPITDHKDLKFIESWLEHNKQITRQLESGIEPEDFEINNSKKAPLFEKIKLAEAVRDERNNHIPLIKAERTYMERA